MSEETNIAWCDSTWNWARGCDKVSPGCKNCYITTTMPFRKIGMKHGDPRVQASAATFNAPLNWNKKPWICDRCHTGPYSNAKLAGNLGKCPNCLKERFHRRRVFSLSLGDWLDLKIPIAWLADAMQIMFQCQEIDFLLCSKRLENWKRRMLDVCINLQAQSPVKRWIYDWLDCKAPKNIWVIGSAENQDMLEKRTEELNRIPAVVRGWSCEPLLGRLDFFRGSHPVDWVIFGGESGKDARPCNIDWIRNGLKQLRHIGWTGAPNRKDRPAMIPCFVKQLGSNAVGGPYGLNETQPLLYKHPKGGDPDEWPADLCVQEWPASAPR